MQRVGEEHEGVDGETLGDDLRRDAAAHRAPADEESLRVGAAGLGEGAPGGRGAPRGGGGGAPPGAPPRAAAPPPSAPPPMKSRSASARQASATARQAASSTA